MDCFFVGLLFDVDVSDSVIVYGCVMYFKVIVNGVGVSG